MSTHHKDARVRSWAASRLLLLLVTASPAILAACSFANAAGNGPSCSLRYCGGIGLVDSPITVQQAGFGYNYMGHIDLSFNPAPPSGMLISAVLNAASIGGQATTTGATTLQIPISGSSLACQLKNPSTYVIFDQNGPATPSGTAPVLATLTFNWNPGGCP